MKYPIFFIAFLVFLTYKAIFIENLFLKIILIWFSVSFGFLAMVYIFNKPEWLGKKHNGKINILNLMIYLPWFFFSLIVWHIQRIISKENPFDEIIENKIWYGRRLLASEISEKFDAVIDLTSEFIEPNIIVDRFEYISLPLLDGIKPNKNFFKKLKEIIPQIKNKKIFVHCAQGHGRTATVTLFIMKNLNFIDKYEDGLKKILQFRPGAKVSKEQFEFIRKAN